MNHQQILLKAVEKAKANGWKGVGNVWQQTVKHSDWQLVKEPMIASAYDVIFNQEFAKAFWPEPDGRIGTPIWKMKLQQMVIAKDPIKYLGNHAL